MTQQAYLVLENGRVFPCRRFGANGHVIGEIVFTTGMTGYIETLTDKSYYGQIVVQTFPLIGNYGIIPGDFEGPGPQVKAYIVKQWCQEPSNFRSEGDLDTFLKEKGVVGIYDLDTRALTKTIRDAGVMNGCIVDDCDRVNFGELRGYRIVDGVSCVSSETVRFFGPENCGLRIGLWDFGVKENIIRELLGRGCQVVTMPHSMKADQIRELSCDGIVLSNGPGDPADNIGIIREIRLLLAFGIPIFGICLGHQLLALAHGGRTMKLKYGHRGFNQPVRDLLTGRIYMTSQNHGYAVVSESLESSDGKTVFENVNDGTCEGIIYPSKPVFSVQFHPEASAGPHDTGFLFDKFLSLPGGKSYAS